MIVEKEWLVQRLNDVDLRIVDCRFDLKNKQLGFQQYKESHLPKAVYFDLEKDLSSEVKTHGGRHPLPELSTFKRKLDEAGIKNSDTIVAYDGGEGSFAARFFWMMKYVGHENVYVLNGGFTSWHQVSYPVDEKIPTFEKSCFEFDIKEHMLASYERVKLFTERKLEQTILVDSRDRIRYAGIEELIDRIPGHIPGAINLPYMDGMKDSSYLSNEEQITRFNHLDHNSEIIVYCGSGVTAMPNYIALKQAGFTNVKVYVGSYSDWVSYEENPVETTL